MPGSDQVAKRLPHILSPYSTTKHIFRSLGIGYIDSHAVQKYN